MFLFFRVEHLNQDDNFQQHSSTQHNTEAIGCEPHPDGCRPNHLSSPLISNFVDFTLLGCGDCLVPVAGVEPARISIHSPHARGDYYFSLDTDLITISIHSPHARGDIHGFLPPSAVPISIHSPHARGDVYTSMLIHAIPISIHSPHARGDFPAGLWICRRIQFQSTPLMRGETVHTANSLECVINFNPLPSCEGRLSYKRDLSMFHVFQSTPLMRGETIRGIIAENPPCISIHSPHARGDLYGCFCRLCPFYFNPLPSCEGRPNCV